MMIKKEFGNISTGKVVTSAMDVATGAAAPAKNKAPQRPASDAEREERISEGRTQGRAGCKAARINMAFSTRNYSAIRLISQHQGISCTEYVNRIIQTYLEEHPDDLAQAKESISAI